jgi:hypothetical protein
MPEGGWTLSAFSDIEEPGLCNEPEARAFRGGENEAVVVLQSPDSRVAVTELLFKRDESAASALIDEVRRQLSVCREYSATSSHIRTSRVLSDLPVPLLGDERIGYRETWSGVPLDGRATVDTALYRERGVLMVLVSSSIDPYGSFAMVIQNAHTKAHGAASQ